jgi:hypothetical protein
MPPFIKPISMTRPRFFFLVMLSRVLVLLVLATACLHDVADAAKDHCGKHLRSSGGEKSSHVDASAKSRRAGEAGATQVHSEATLSTSAAVNPAATTEAVTDHNGLDSSRKVQKTRRSNRCALLTKHTRHTSSHPRLPSPPRAAPPPSLSRTTVHKLPSTPRPLALQFCPPQHSPTQPAPPPPHTPSIRTPPSTANPT